MAEPVRKDEPIHSKRFPESPSRPSPVPVTRTGSDAAGLLPEHATDKPLGEWPRETLDDYLRLRKERRQKTSAAADALESIREKAKPITEFVQDRVADMRHRFRIIRGRLESGEIQEQMKERASDLTDEASRQARIARSRAEFYARNYPLQFIAGAAAAGFLIGFLLRMGRDE